MNKIVDRCAAPKSEIDSIRTIISNSSAITFINIHAPGIVAGAVTRAIYAFQATQKKRQIVQMWNFGLQTDMPNGRPAL